MLLRAAAARTLPCSLDAGSAGFYAGASHPVALAARVLPRAAASMLLPRLLDAGSAGFYTGARHTVGARPRLCCLGRRLRGRCHARLTRGQRWLLRWREPPCGAKRRVCCLGWRFQGRCCARSTQATLASTLARASLWRGSTRLLLERRLQDPCHARSTRAALASTLARATLWREAARVLPRAAALRSLLCSLNAGNAGFYAGASHPVARVDAIAA